MYYVIHSTDPYLLARFSTCLQMAGWPVDLPWCDRNNPFTGHIYLDTEDDVITFFLGDWSVSFGDDATRFTLTERNFETVLLTIIDQK